ncbi:hypothetical protein BLNAU_9289 [Blattamonas nauphoetae]|uniref:Uncharacterized protein n=1 Tax=Blattamonas nauphoetae TaxID=2049346 RepID=A0ABQ9XW95_9EUKA|nr:hypothetical protein BLNAU_9289 [Blattamonas nauphoetae]
MMRRRTRRGAGRRNWKTGTASFRSSSSSSLCCPVIRCLRHTAAEGRGEEAAEHQHSHLHTTPLAEHVLSVDEVERALELFRRAEEEVVVPFMQLARREWLKCIRGSLHSPTRADCSPTATLCSSTAFCPQPPTSPSSSQPSPRIRSL